MLIENNIRSGCEIGFISLVQEVDILNWAVINDGPGLSWDTRW